MQNWLSQFNLNPNQNDAVIYDEGPLFVIAGAGTGKTKTLTTKISYLIHEKKVFPSRILAFTFTNKAANEIKERTQSVVDVPIYGMWINTFHAFGLKVLRQDIAALNLGYNESFSVIDEDDALKIIRDLIKDHNIDSKKYLPKKARNLISQLKYQMITEIEEPVYQRIFDLYGREMIKNNLVDFDDLICYTRQLFVEKPHILKKYQDKFDYLLVDEFQDTDKLQYDLIYLLGLSHRKIFLVGDPDQSIYGFRGAHYGNSSKFIKDFNAKIIVLDQNYRSTNAILEKANQLIVKNINRPKAKNLTSNLGYGEHVSIVELDNDYQEAQYVINEIKHLVSKGFKYSDIAILYRHNALSRLFEDTAIRENIPYIIYGGISFYERREIKDMLAYIRVILNPNQDFFLKRIINVPKRKIGKTTIEKLQEWALLENKSMFESIHTFDVSKNAKQSLLSFKETILKMKEEIEYIEDMRSLIIYIGEQSGYVGELKAIGDEDSLDRINNIKELASIFVSSEFYYEGTRLEKIQHVLDQIALYTDRDKQDVNLDSVRLSNYHQVKGLEFPVVFMATMEQGIFPDDRAYESSADLEEERRVAYVGMTRAKKLLYLTGAKRRMLYGQIRQHGLSIFVRESIGVNDSKKVKAPPKMKIFHASSFKDGDKVEHASFGLGVVVGLGEDVVKVAFQMPHGIKILSDKHPALKKIS